MKGKAIKPIHIAKYAKIVCTICTDYIGDCQ